MEDKDNDFQNLELLPFQEVIREKVGQLLLDFSCTIDDEAFNYVFSKDIAYIVEP